MKMGPATLQFWMSILIACTSGQPSTNSTLRSCGPSPKKGIVVPYWHNARCGDFDAFSTVSWWYNYHTVEDMQIYPCQKNGWCKCGSNNSTHCLPTPGTVQYVPMISSIPGTGHLTKHPDGTDLPVADQYEYLLGFNEPNIAVQANLYPKVAAAGWMKDVQLKYPDKNLVSPAVAGSQTKWMGRFLEECEALGCRVDYLATHEYSKTGNVDELMDKLEKFSAEYGKKIWLTEFSLANTYDEEKIVAFVKELLPRLEAADFVYKYAWFVTRFYPDKDDDETKPFWLSDKNSLVDQDSAKLTAVGEAYNYPWHCQ